jgi:hypothetical protein
MTEPTEPPRGAFDWLVHKPIEHEFQIPLPKAEPGVEQTLRVVITAKATVAPNRAWAGFIVIWTTFVLALLAAIAANTAHGAEPGRWDWTSRTWESQDAQQGARDWGALQPGRTTTYAPWQGPGGQQGRCAFWRWRGEIQMRCSE